MEDDIRAGLEGPWMREVDLSPGMLGRLLADVCFHVTEYSE